MLLNMEKSGEQDKEHSKELLVNNNPDVVKTERSLSIREKITSNEKKKSISTKDFSFSPSVFHFKRTDIYGLNSE